MVRAVGTGGTRVERISPGLETEAGSRLCGKAHGEGQLIAGGLALLAGSFAYPYLQGLLSWIGPACLFKRVTGLPCLLCGMTRSLAATAHGHLREAFRLHLLGPPLYAAAAAMTALLVCERALGRRLLPRPDEKARKKMARCALGLLAAAWAARLAFFGAYV